MKKIMKAIGYIVECDTKVMLQSEDKLLYFGNYATIFRRREQAKAAIKRTINKRRETYDRDFESEFGKLRVVMVKEAS